MVKVFLTGGTGFIGSRVVKALVDQGHYVTALSRRTGTDLEKLNVTVVKGTLTDVDVIAAAAAEADAVMHLGFEHDFADYPRCCEQDLAVVKAIVKALSGSGKLFANTGASAGPGDSGEILGKEDRPVLGPRAASEAVTLQANKDGVRGVVMRLPPFVYTKDFSFFYNVMYRAAEKKGSASFVGEGKNKLSVVHVDDAAKAYVALLSHPDASGVYNVPGENGVTSKDIAEAIAQKLHCKAESVTMEIAAQEFGGFVAKVVSMNAQADSSRIRQDLDWQPQYTCFKQTI